ncbi:MAG: hypothetical protein K0V04_26140 [Deltaproteobacteria bacterium]|nr:hypothetical protein [Deltaproteobacteria bacterium]
MLDLRPTASALLLLCASCNCNERPIEEQLEPDLRIEALCEVRCSRLMECAFEYVGTVSFDDEAGCYQACVGDVVWERTCAELKQSMYDCRQQYECPEYALHYTSPAGEAPCQAEQSAYSSCLPGEPR